MARVTDYKQGDFTVAKRMVRSVDLVVGLASTFEVLAMLGAEKVKSFVAQHEEGSFGAALGNASLTWLNTELTDNDKARLAELAASKSKVEAEFSTRISKVDLATVERVQAAMTGKGSPAEKITAAMNAGAAGEEEKQTILAAMAEAVKGTQTEIDQINDKKLVAARDMFATLYDLDLTPPTVRVAGQQRVALEGDWQFLPYDQMGEFVSVGSTDSIYYREEAATSGKFLRHEKIGSRSHGVKIAAEFWKKREAFPKDTVGRLDAALAVGKSSGYTTTLGVGKVDDAHPHGSFCKKLDKLPQWVLDAQAAIAKNEEEKPQK